MSRFSFGSYYFGAITATVLGAVLLRGSPPVVLEDVFYQDRNNDTIEDQVQRDSSGKEIVLYGHKDPETGEVRYLLENPSENR